jgi:membrane-associated phospholipid phosphatase
MARHQRAWVIGAVSSAALVLLSYLFLDRTLATLSHDHLHGIEWFVWLTYIPEPFVLVACAALVIAASRRIAGASIGWLDDLMLRAGISVIVASAIKDQLKWVFGRTWPETWINANPSYFGDGSYGFHPFAGGVAYSSFPSGNTSLILSFVSVLWILCPRMRWLSVALAVAVPVGLIGADYHWLSDIIAGGAFGTAVGVVAATLGRAARI